MLKKCNESICCIWYVIYYIYIYAWVWDYWNVRTSHCGYMYTRSTVCMNLLCRDRFVYAPTQCYIVQCKPDISRLVGSMERYRDISGSAIYRATAMSQNPGQVFQRVVSGDGAFVCLAANSARRQRISWHWSKFDVALQNRVVEFQTKAVCA